MDAFPLPLFSKKKKYTSKVLIFFASPFLKDDFLTLCPLFQEIDILEEGT